MSFVNRVLKPTRPGLSASSEYFGWALAGNSTRNSVIVGSQEQSTAGRAYVFSYSPSTDTFALTTALEDSSRSSGDFFAASVAIDPQSTARYFCGEPGKRRVLAFTNPAAPGPANQTYEITANNYLTNFPRLKGFGESMSIVDDNLLIGATFADPNSLGIEAGAVYSMFLTPSNSYSQGQIITSPNAQNNEQFGLGLNTYNTDLLVGAPGSNIGVTVAAGRVYYYTFNSSLNTWSLQQTITCPDGAQTNGAFGYSVSVKGNFAAIGSPGYNYNGVTANGKVYFYQKIGGLWVNVPGRDLFYKDVILSSSGDEPRGKNLGLSVALSCNPALSQAVIVAGAPEAYNFDPTLGRVGSAVLGVPGTGPWGASNGYIVNRNPGRRAAPVEAGPLSGRHTNLGRNVSADFDSRGFILGAAPLPGKLTGYTADPGAVYQIKDNFVQDFYPAAAFYTIPIQVAVVSTAIDPINLANYINNAVPVVSWAAAGLPAGLSLNSSTGVITGTVNTLGSYNSTIIASNVAGITTNVPISFRIISSNINYGPIPADRPISIGGSAVGDGGGSLNLLLSRGISQANSVLSEIEERSSHPMNLTQISDPQAQGTAVCVPNQIEKLGTAGGGGTDTWFPAGVGGTFKPYRMSEFRAAYRWGMANVKPFGYTSQYVTAVSCSSRKPRSKALCPGNATLTLTVSNPTSPGGSPYYWLIFNPGSPGSDPNRGNPNYSSPGGWNVALGGWLTAGAGVSSYTKYPAGNPADVKPSSYVYTVRLKDTVGCGLIGNIVSTVNVTYPQAASG